MPIAPIPAPGERALLTGATGSGKTTLACWLIQRLAIYPRVVLDLKIEPKFAALPDTVVTGSHSEVMAAMRAKQPHRHIVYQPPVEVVQDPEAVDAILLAHYRHGRDLPIYVDEAYLAHVSGRAGPGLISLLTRGRSRGITTILATQRPVWLSRFAWTEAQRFYVLRLVDRADRSRVADIVPVPVDALIPRYHWIYYDFDLEAPIHYGPIPIGEDHGYVDAPERKWM